MTWVSFQRVKCSAWLWRLHVQFAVLRLDPPDWNNSCPVKDTAMASFSWVGSISGNGWAWPGVARGQHGTTNPAVRASRCTWYATLEGGKGVSAEGTLSLAVHGRKNTHKGIVHLDLPRFNQLNLIWWNFEDFQHDLDRDFSLSGEWIHTTVVKWKQRGWRTNGSAVICGSWKASEMPTKRRELAHPGNEINSKEHSLGFQDKLAPLYRYRYRSSVSSPRHFMRYASQSLMFHVACRSGQCRETAAGQIILLQRTTCAAVYLWLKKLFFLYIRITMTCSTPL